MKAFLALSLESPMALFGLIAGGIRLLNGHCNLEASHLGHQQLNLRPISRLLFYEPILSQVNPTDSVD